MLKIALDTSCLNIKQGNSVLNQLEELHQRGEIELVTSSVLEREQKNNLNSDCREKYLEKIEFLSKKLEVAVVDQSRVGQCVTCDSMLNERLKEIILEKQTSKSNDFYDYWILLTSVIHGCNYFMTTNTTDFIKNDKQERIEELGIKVRTPYDDSIIDEILSDVADIQP